jgi:hypothetical protein
MTTRERLLLLVAALHLLALALAGPIWAQRDRAAFGEGFRAEVVRAVREHPVEAVGGTAAAVAAGIAGYRALRGAKKEDGNG